LILLQRSGVMVVEPYFGHFVSDKIITEGLSFS